MKRHNERGYHPGLGFTPQLVWDGSCRAIAERRHRRLHDHYLHYPDRYYRPPKVQLPPAAVSINAPEPRKL